MDDKHNYNINVFQRSKGEIKMSFWNPIRMREDRQKELDTRIILGIAEEKLKKDLEKVEKKIEKQRNELIKTDMFSVTRKQGENMKSRADVLAVEKNQILRRLDLIIEIKEKINE